MIVRFGIAQSRTRCRRVGQYWVDVAQPRTIGTMDCWNHWADVCPLGKPHLIFIGQMLDILKNQEKEGGKEKKKKKKKKQLPT